MNDAVLVCIREMSAALARIRSTSFIFPRVHLELIVTGGGPGRLLWIMGKGNIETGGGGGGEGGGGGGRERREGGRGRGAGEAGLGQGVVPNRTMKRYGHEKQLTLLREFERLGWGRESCLTGP